MTCDCVPAVNKWTGEILKIKVSAQRKARNALILREGPPPFDGAICRHLCENDSMMRNGFVCTLHTTWGTSFENSADRSDDNKKAAAILPNHPNKLKVICPYCGKVGNKMPMSYWHFDNCKFRNLSGEISEGTVVEGE